MQIIYTPKAKEHFDFWVKTGNKPVLRKILELTKSVIKSPYEGIGKPEPLKHELSGYWCMHFLFKHILIPDYH